MTGARPSADSGRSGGASRPAPGFALLAVLLALLLLTALTHGTLALSRFHAYASLAEGRVLEARVAARSGVRAVASTFLPDSLPVGGGDLRRTLFPGAGIPVDASVVRIGAEWLWLEGVARVGRGAVQAVHRAGAVYWTLDPVERARSLSATMEVGGGLFAPSSVSVLPLRSGALDPGYRLGICSGDQEPALFTGWDPGPAVVALDSGADAPDSGTPMLGLLGWSDLSVREGSGSGPDADGTVRVIEGSFEVPKEGVRGVLAVTGDVEIPESREMVGLVLVGGSLTVRDGARLVGAVRARGSVTIQGDGRVLGSRCTVHHQLREHPGLSLPLPAPDGTWLRIP